MYFLHCLLLVALASSAPQVVKLCFSFSTSLMLVQDVATVRGERYHPWRGAVHVSRSSSPDPWSGLYSNPDRVSFDCRVISDHYAPCFHICLLCFLWPCLFCQGDHCRWAICLLPLANLLLLLPSWLHWTVPRQLPLHKWLMMITCPFWYIYLFIWLIKLVFIKYNDDTLSILISKITNICLIKVVFITSHFLTDNWGMLWWKW